MSRTSLAVGGFAAGALALALYLFYTSEGAVKAREREARKAEAQAQSAGATTKANSALLQVSAARVQRAEAPQLVQLSGLLQPLRATWVAAETSGRVTKRRAQEHAGVQSGAVLVELDSALQNAELIRAQAQHKLAEAELSRQRKLGKIASRAALDSAAAKERSAYAALLEARAKLRRTKIRAPFAGVVNALLPDPGAFVSPGVRVAEVLDVSQLELEAAVNDKQISAIKTGAPVQVRIDALGNQPFAGRIARIARAPHPESKRYPVVVVLPNKEGRLLPGMLAVAEIQAGAAAAVLVPARALLREFQLDYVFALIPTNSDAAQARVQRRRVRTRPVAFRPDWVEITEGLGAAPLVAVDALRRLKNGARVQYEVVRP